MGPYCDYCKNRCFVHLPPLAALPETMRKAYQNHTKQLDIIATCPMGQLYEKKRVGVCYDEVKPWAEQYRSVKKKKALGSDLNWTMIGTKSGDVFPQDGDDFVFLPGVLEKLSLFSAEGLRILILTNQAQVCYHEFQDEIMRLHPDWKRKDYLSLRETGKLLRGVALECLAHGFSPIFLVSIWDERLRWLLMPSDDEVMAEVSSPIPPPLWLPQVGAESLADHLKREIGADIPVAVSASSKWRKPEIGMFTTIQELWGISPDEMVFVGDRSEDEKAARDAHVSEYFTAWDFFGWPGSLAPDAQK